MANPASSQDVAITMHDKVEAKSLSTKGDVVQVPKRMLFVAGAVIACLFISAAVLIPIAWTQTGEFAPDRPSEQEIAKLFDVWNAALQTGDPNKVADLYAPKAVLLPTVSNVPRNTRALIVDYFEHFLKLKPKGHIDESFIAIPCNKCGVNSGLYTFDVTRDTGPDVVKARYTFEYHKIDGKWLIVEHHSSAMPEAELPSETLVASLFDNWNAALKTGDPEKVAALYAPDAILLPTVSNRVRANHSAIVDYFVHFLQLKPEGHIIEQHIMVPNANLAINSGVYVFNLSRNGTADSVTARYTFVYKKVGSNWMIEEHHSSAMPEQILPSEDEIKDLFKLWNEAIQTGDPEKVADRYAPDAILLPTLSNQLRANRTAIIDYFTEFLKKKPVGTVLESHVHVFTSTLAMDDGIYRFDFGATNTNATARYSFVYTKKGDEWLIEEHHSSKMPEP